ncbi:UNVERIFIED_CONTAM: hypothetical protein Sindi_0956900 [Sesamum indicum]
MVGGRRTAMDEIRETELRAMAIADLEVGGGASLKVDHGGPSSSSFNLDEFLKLANRVIDQGDDASMAALRDLQIRWKSRFGDGGNRRCLLPRIAGHTAVGNGGETAAKVQLPTAAAVCDSSSETGGNGGISRRPMSAGGRKVAANFSVATGSPCAFFRRVGERPGTFSATGVVAGADVAAEVGDKVGEVDERAADISPIRADVMHDARAEVIHDARADVIPDARADVIHDARADVIHPGADITNFMGKKKQQPGERFDASSLVYWEHSASHCGVGKPLYPDAITRACTRLDFARVCVMIDVTQKLEKHIIIMTPDEDGGETPCKVDIEYEWLPPKCTGCMMLGHSVKECSLTNPQKQTKPPVKVYVPKANVPPPPPATEERVKKHKTVVVVEDKVTGDEGTKQNKRYTSSQIEKGKEVVTFNPFDDLNSLDDAEENTRGPNTCSPSSSDPC